MNIKKYILTSLLIFLIMLLWNFIVHGVILVIESEAIKSLFRSDMNDLLWLSFTIALLISFIFVFGYTRLITRRSLLGGLIYGFVFGVTAAVLVDVNQYILYPLPSSIVIKWSLFGVAEYSVYGLIVAGIMKK